MRIAFMRYLTDVRSKYVSSFRETCTDMEGRNSSAAN